jgi:hypothetical protein
MITSASLLCHRLLLTIVSLGGLGFVASRLPAAGIDDPTCKIVVDAAAKMEEVPNHQYMTMTRQGAGGKTTEGESIHIGDTSYVKTKGTWHISPLSPKALAEQRKENIRDSKVFTCKYDRDDQVDGEAAAIYKTHQESDAIKADAKIWISKKRGLVLKEIVTQPEENQSITIRVDYSNVQKPDGVK